MNRFACSIARWMAGALLSLVAATSHAQVPLPIFVVTNTADSGTGSLRQAIISTNSMTSCPAGTAIEFDLPPTAGWHTISVLSELPAINCSGLLLIASAQQSGGSPNTKTDGTNDASLKVALDGTSCAGSCNGLVLAGSGVTVHGLSVHSFAASGLRLEGGGRIVGNYIGVDPSGAAKPNGGYGIEVVNGFAQIGEDFNAMAADRNLISANSQGGILFTAQTGYGEVAGNSIGGGRDGSAANGNGGPGVHFPDNVFGGRVGRNYVRYNSGAGIRVDTGNSPEMLDNRIYANGGAGIDLGGDGPTANAALTGNFALLKHPDIASVVHVGNGDTIITASITGGGANRFVIVQFFANGSSPATRSGQVLLAPDKFVNLDGNGAFTFTHTISGAWMDNVSATATHDECFEGCFATSEISPAVAATAPDIALSPSPLAFGGVTLNTTASLDLTITNPGTAPLHLSGPPTIVGGGFAVSDPNSCASTPIAPNGGTCIVVVGFSPTAAVDYSATLSVPSDATDVPATVSLTGSGGIATISLSPTSLAFGPVRVGSTASDAVTITNTGDGMLNISLAGVTGAGFSRDAPACLFNPIAPAGTCVVTVMFTPASLGPLVGEFSLGSNAPPGTHTVALTGTGTQPGVSLSPSPLAFGDVPVGSVATAPVTITNTGASPLNVSGVAASGPGFAVNNPACLASPIAPSGSCQLTVSFAPTVPGPHSGSLSVASDAPESPHAVALSGNGATPGLALSAASVSFGPQAVGTTSPAQTVVLTNSGGAPLVISSVASSGDFGYSGCGPATLAPGATCAFSITFRPLAEGPQSGSIVITSNAAGSPHAISLAGQGGAPTMPMIRLSPSSFDFGVVRTNTSLTIRGRLLNIGNAPLELSTISVEGEFFSQANDCPGSVPAGGSCEVAVTYAPQAGGVHTGHLSVFSNAVPNPAIAAVGGISDPTPPPLLQVAAALDFGQVIVGSQARRALSLANTGGSTLVISDLRMPGSGPFGVESACVRIEPGASCDVIVVFAPARPGTFGARLDIASNHPDGARQVALSGIGVPEPVADLEVSAMGLGFGNQALGVTAEGRHVRLTSVGTIPVQLGSFSITGEFAVDPGGCPASLAPEASCEIVITFRPLATGPRSGVLTIESDARDGPATVSLTGVGCRFFSIGSARIQGRMCAP
jgi:hypothetical protein